VSGRHGDRPVSIPSYVSFIKHTMATRGVDKSRSETTHQLSGRVSLGRRRVLRHFGRFLDTFHVNVVNNIANFTRTRPHQAPAKALLKMNDRERHLLRRGQSLCLPSTGTTPSVRLRRWCLRLTRTAISSH
jgi:hypothetical protein